MLRTKVTGLGEHTRAPGTQAGDDMGGNDEHPAGGGGLLDELLDDVTTQDRVEKARQAVAPLIDAVGRAVKQDQERQVLEEVVESAIASRTRAQHDAAKVEIAAVTNTLIGAVLADTKAKTSAEPPATAEPARRLRRPIERFGPDEMLALDDDTLLGAIAAADAETLVAVCAATGAGALAERALMLLPAGTRDALFDALKRAGRAPDEDSARAFGRFETIVAELN